MVLWFGGRGMAFGTGWAGFKFRRAIYYNMNRLLHLKEFQCPRLSKEHKIIYHTGLFQGVNDLFPYVIWAHFRFPLTPKTSKAKFWVWANHVTAVPLPKYISLP